MSDYKTLAKIALGLDWEARDAEAEVLDYFKGDGHKHILTIVGNNKSGAPHYNKWNMKCVIKRLGKPGMHLLSKTGEILDLSQIDPQIHVIILKPDFLLGYNKVKTVIADYRFYFIEGSLAGSNVRNIILPEKYHDHNTLQVIWGGEVPEGLRVLDYVPGGGNIFSRIDILTFITIAASSGRRCSGGGMKTLLQKCTQHEMARAYYMSHILSFI